MSTVIAITFVVVIVGVVAYGLVRPLTHLHYRHQRLQAPHLYSDRQDW